MRPRDFDDRVFDDFRGLYDRGDDDQVPEKYFIDCLNVDFEIGECRTRAGLVPSITVGYGTGPFGNVKRTANFITDHGIITLILDINSNLYTYSNRAGDTATTPRITVAGADDFSAIQMLGKIFISFHNGKTGLPGVNLKVFIPAAAIANDEFRNAGGAAPTQGSEMNAATGAAGNVIIGNYLIAVTFLTTSGHYTPPGPIVSSIFDPTFYTAPGGSKINLSNIPVGPSGTAKRQILITKVNSEEYFFLPEPYGGLINDNVTTTTVLDFNSLTDLIDSADYLFDIMSFIPAGVGLQDFNGRLAVWGEAADTSLIRVSNVGEPETIDSVDNLIVVNKDDGFALRAGFVIRNVFYACSELGIYGIVDNDDIPATWKPLEIDRSTNIPCHGVASYFSESGIKNARGFALIADMSGILLFDGSVQKPPITDAINDVWQRINTQYRHVLQLVVDETAHKIYCAVPLDLYNDNNVILMGDYNTCRGKIPSVEGIKWSVWNINPEGVTRTASDISMTLVYPEFKPTLKVGSASGGGKIWKFDPVYAGKDDSSTYNYESSFETSLLYFKSGYIHTFVGASMKVSGEGLMIPSVSGLDGEHETTLKEFDLEAQTGKFYLIKSNFQNEKAAYKFTVLAGKFQLGDLTIYGKPTSPMRPQ